MMQWQPSHLQRHALVAVRRDVQTAANANERNHDPAPQSHVTRHASHVTRHTPHATRHTSHVTRHSSHATRHTSHVTRHTSHVTRHSSHATRHHALLCITCRVAYGSFGKSWRGGCRSRRPCHTAHRWPETSRIRFLEYRLRLALEHHVIPLSSHRAAFHLLSDETARGLCRGRG
jgi:hypothetical protein